MFCVRSLRQIKTKSISKRSFRQNIPPIEIISGLYFGAAALIGGTLSVAILNSDDEKPEDIFEATSCVINKIINFGFGAAVGTTYAVVSIIYFFLLPIIIPVWIWGKTGKKSGNNSSEIS